LDQSSFHLERSSIDISPFQAPEPWDGPVTQPHGRQTLKNTKDRKFNIIEIFFQFLKKSSDIHMAL
jgi:hypothetical protein